MRFQNFGDLDFHLLRSNVTAIGSGFLLMVNIVAWPNMSVLRDISLPNISDPEFDLSRSLKVNKSKLCSWTPRI